MDKYGHSSQRLLDTLYCSCCYLIVVIFFFSTNCSQLMLICVIGNNGISILQPNSSGLVQPCVDTSFSDNGSICFRSDPGAKGNLSTSFALCSWIQPSLLFL